MQIAEKVKKFFHNEGIHSTTIQPEFVELSEADTNGEVIKGTADCYLDCPPDDKNNCAPQTCCG